MAQRRMFNKTITNSDNFLDMPDSSQNLYFHLSMNADDDGFVDNWKSIMRMSGHKEDDLKVLIAKQYIIPFESGVIVIRHWRLNNYLRNDRFTPTNYKNEFKQLTLDENNVYKMDTTGIPNGNPDKVSIDKISIKEKEIYKEKEDLKVDKRPPHTPQEIKHKYGEYKNVMLKDTELEKLKKDFSNYEELIKYLDEYIEMKGYKAKSHYLAIRKWVVDAVNERKQKKGIEPEWLDKEIKEVGLTDEQEYWIKYVNGEDQK